MQLFSDKIEVEARSVISTFSPLTNTIFTGGKNRVANLNISEVCSFLGCSKVVVHKQLCNAHYIQNYRASLDICKFDGCDNHVPSKNLMWCSTHALRIQKHGSPDITLNDVGVGSSFEQRFWSRVVKNGNEKGCWLWQGCTDPNGYGVVGVSNKTLRGAHRFAYYLQTGKIPKLHLLHSCDIPNCVWAGHLTEGTQAENVADMVSKRRQPLGTKSATAKLTDAQVLKIKIALRNGVRGRVLARTYNVGESCISNIKTGLRWWHIEIPDGL